MLSTLTQYVSKQIKSNRKLPFDLAFHCLYRGEKAFFISAKQTKLTLGSALNSAFYIGFGLVVSAANNRRVFPINNEKFDLHTTS